MSVKPLVSVLTNHPLVLRSLERILASTHSVKSYSQTPTTGAYDWLLIVDTYSVERWLELAIHCGCQQKRPVIILADDHPNYEEELRLVYLGVRGIVPMTSLESDVPLAIDAVFQGRLWIRRATLTEHIIRTNPSGGFLGSRFTLREEQVIMLLAKRFSNKEIANLLGISNRTAKFHVSNVLRKFGIRDRRDLLNTAAKPPNSCQAKKVPVAAGIVDIDSLRKRLV